MLLFCTLLCMYALPHNEKVKQQQQQQPHHQDGSRGKGKAEFIRTHPRTQDDVGTMKHKN